MKTKILNWLLIIDILTILLIVAIIFIPSSVIRIIIGLPFLLFFSGYTLVAALFPPPGVDFADAGSKTEQQPGMSPEKTEKKEMDRIERVALSFGMSIAVVALIGLGLNYTPWGIRLLPILLSISVFIFVMSAIAMIREYRSFNRFRLVTELHIKLPGWEGSAFNKTLSVTLILAILGAMGVLAYTVVLPKVGERFTEFYILGSAGKAEGYPSVFVMKDNQVVSVQYGGSNTTSQAGPGKVTMGIVNHEQQNTSYSVAITVDAQPAEIYYAGKMSDRLDQIELPQEGKWEQEIGFVPTHTGANQKVEFLLYKNSENEPVNTLHLWVNVMEQ